MNSLFKSNKKGMGALDMLGSLGVALASLVIVFSVTFLILANVQDQIVDVEEIADESNTSQRTVAYNATADLTDAAADIPGWIPLVIITVIGGLLIGLVSYIRK